MAKLDLDTLLDGVCGTPGVPPHEFKSRAERTSGQIIMLLLLLPYRSPERVPFRPKPPVIAKVTSRNALRPRLSTDHCFDRLLTRRAAAQQLLRNPLGMVRPSCRTYAVPFCVRRQSHLRAAGWT